MEWDGGGGEIGPSSRSGKQVECRGIQQNKEAI